MPAVSTESPIRHLLQIDGMSREELVALLDAGDAFRRRMDEGTVPRDTLAGRIVANLFFEDSTRTRCSFAVAAMRLGARVVDLTGIGSSISKGETIVDTALNVEAMGVDVLVVRCGEAGEPHQIARAVRCPVINGGDGRHGHPTQGLLDTLTLRRHLGELAGRRVAIVGDVANSRVARSTTHALTKLGADVVLVGPPDLVPRTYEQITDGPGAVAVSHDLDAVLDGLDAIVMLRVQFERHGAGSIGPDYRAYYGLTVERARALRPGVPVLHPGPMNRGLEIDSDVADDPERSIILDQVTNGVAIRMAVLTAVLQTD
ncbi:MAG: aspartate carbamoyltransferase catalytic subunit [Planctomycetota bacterium]|jgi:aspartate carbamoyltransferase catalytic subunit